MAQQIGVQVEGAFFKEDGTNLSWSELIDIFEESGLLYGGKTLLVNEEGEIAGDIFKEFAENEIK